jgi:DamX protein
MTGAASGLQQRIGLALDPFAPGALPGFFFVGGQRRFLAQRAVHVLYFGGGIVLLSGARGSGKSRLLEEVLIDLRDLADSCHIGATVMMDGGEIRRMVASALGLPMAATLDNTSLVAALVRWQPADREPQPIALIIDDAHLLAVPALAETLSLVLGAGGRLRLLLAGEPDLVAASEQAGAAAVERIELPPLDLQETADYVATRLQAAGLRAESPLSPTQLRELHQRSAGNFAAIHEHLPAMFAAPPAPRRSLRDRLFAIGPLRALKDVPLQHLAIGAGLLLVVVLMIVNRRDGDESADPGAGAASSSGDKLSVALALPTTPVQPELSTPGRDQAAPVRSVAAPEPVVSPSVQAPVTPPPPPASPKKTESSPLVVSGQKITLPAPSPKAAPVAATAPQQTVPPTPTPAPTSSPSTAADAPATAVAEVGTTADERELLGWSNKQFALQLLGAGSSATVNKFIQQAGGATKLYAYRTDLNGRPWYIVVTGPYPSRGAATAAADTLPAALRNQKPWPRAVKNIQADIRQRK